MIKQLSTQVTYQNPWMTVREDQVEFPNGHRGIFGVVEKPDFALIIPFDGQFLWLVEQYRYPIQRTSLEFPQGKHEDNAEINPFDLARAELQEETGLMAASLEEIGYFHEAPGYCNQAFHIFLATNLTQHQANLELTESDVVVHKLTPAQFEAKVVAGEVTDAPTISAYGLAKIKQLW